MKYLITGATGFIGPHLLHYLLEAGHSCRCLVRENSDTRELTRDKINGEDIDIVTGDITQPDTLSGIADDIDCVLHMATLGHMSNFTVTEEMFEAINIQGTVNIMNEALRSGVKRIVHCSSVAAMGICSDVPATEESVCNPHHAYGRSKFLAEDQVKKMVKEQNLPASIVRFSMVYGPGDHRDMLKLVKYAKKGIFPKIGSKPKLTPLIHVKDAIEGLLCASEKGRAGEIYLITNEQSEKFDELRKMILKILGIYRIPLYIPEWAALLLAGILEFFFTCMGKTPPVAKKNIESTLADRIFSIEKAQKELGFSPIIPVEEGLKETIWWYKEKGWI